MNDKNTPQVSRQERVIYGGSAPVIRLIGNAVSELERAVEALSDSLNSLHDADALSASAVSKNFVCDAYGRSDVTVWVDSVFTRVWEQQKTLSNIYREIASEAIQQETKLRQGVDSMQVTGNGEMAA